MLLLKCLTKVFISKFYFITGLENEEKLVTWSSKSTKLLISLRQEKNDHFDNGKVRRKVAWDKVAEQFNANSYRRWELQENSAAINGKKIEEEFKKVREHNAKTGSDKKECEFEDELAEFFQSDPKIISPLTVSSFPLASAGSQSTNEDEEFNTLGESDSKEKKETKVDDGDNQISDRI